MNTFPGCYGHVAVRLNHHIVVTAGTDPQNSKAMSTPVIWTYNLYTEQWRKHQIPDKKNAPHPVAAACAATIKEHIYMFGGWDLKSANITGSSVVKDYMLPYMCAGRSRRTK